jgi:hypothetical protein
MTEKKSNPSEGIFAKEVFLFPGLPIVLESEIIEDSPRLYSKAPSPHSSSCETEEKRV